MVSTIWPSPAMRMKALGLKTLASAAWPRANGRLKLIIRPPPAAAPTRKKWRRDRPLGDGDRWVRRLRASGDRRSSSALLSVRLRGALDRFANAQIGPAAADIAGHRSVDVGFRRVRISREQRGGGHDLARLAVAALHDPQIEPGLLDLGTRSGRTDRLDRRDFGHADAVDGRGAGTCGRAVDVHGAGA